MVCTLNAKAEKAQADQESLIITLSEYYVANKDSDYEWVIIQGTNNSAFLYSTPFIEIYESMISEVFTEKNTKLVMCL